MQIYGLAFFWVRCQIVWIRQNEFFSEISVFACTIKGNYYRTAEFREVLQDYLYHGMRIGQVVIQKSRLKCLKDSEQQCQEYLDCKLLKL